MKTNAPSGWLLVVEDNLDIWMILQALLPDALPDVEVIHAVDAPAALTYLENCTKQQQTLPRLILPQRRSAELAPAQPSRRDRAARPA